MKKKGQLWDTLIPWIIGIAVLILVILIYVLLDERGRGAIEFFKNLLRFGR